MKKAIVACMIFVAAFIMHSDVFAQRSVNSAEDAALAAKESLKNPNYSSSQVNWLNNVINVINLNEPAYKDVAAQNNKAIEERKGN